MNGAGGVFGKHSRWSTNGTFWGYPKPLLCVNADLLFRSMSMKKNYPF